MRFHDLGPLVVEVDGADHAVTGKQAEILGVLLVRPNLRVAVETVIESVWGESAGEGTASTLESHVWRLRRLLEPGRGAREAPTVLINDSGGYRLAVDVDQVDSLLLDQLAGEARELLRDGRPDQVLVHCDRGLALWRGRLLDGLPESPTLAVAATRLSEVRDQLRELRIDALIATGDSAQALVGADLLITELPFREHVWAQRMLALHAAGRTDEALGTYDRACEVLLDEVGIEPGRELEDLRRRLRDGEPVGHSAPVTSTEPSPASSSPTEIHLPTAVTPLIGREDVLAPLVRLVTARPVVTVVGAAGSGKTRLTVEVARAALGEFPDGVWFVDLTAVDTPDLVADLVVSTVGLTPASGSSALDTLRDYARPRRMLLLLDNCEHVLGAAADVVDAATNDGSQCSVLLTSREPLGVGGETVWPLGPLGVPEPDGTAGPDAPEAAAVTLFLERVRAADPTVALDDEALRTVDRITVALDGLPLALELAAARVRSSTLAEIEEQVSADPSGLRRIGRGRPDHRETVRGAIEWSHRLLTPEEQVLHRRLAVLPGAFTRDAAVAVAGVDPLTEDDVRELLPLLVHRSLLVPVRSPRADGPSLFRQLATVRGHATYALESAGETTSVTDLRDAWVDALVRTRPRLGHADDIGWHAAIDDAFPTVRATLRRRLVEHPSPAGVRLMTPLTLYWYNRNRMSEGGRWIDACEPLLPQCDPLDRLVAYADLAASHGVAGRLDDVGKEVVRIDALMRGGELDGLDVDELIEVGEITGILSADVYIRGAVDHAVTLVDRVGELADRVGDEGLLALADTVRCLVASATSPPELTAERAAAAYERAMAVDHVLTAWLACGVRAGLALALRDPDGLEWSNRTLPLQLRQGSLHLALPLESRANFAALAGRPYDAARLFAASQHQARRDGVVWPRRPVSATYFAEVEAALPRGEFEAASAEGARLTPAEALALTDTFKR